MRYLKGILDLGYLINLGSSLALTAHSETTRRSTTGYCSLIGSNLMSWSAKKPTTVARFSTESKCRAMATIAAEATQLTIPLRDLRIPQASASVLFCDNMSALHLFVNPVFHARAKHIEIDHHYARENKLLSTNWKQDTSILPNSLLIFLQTTAL